MNSKITDKISMIFEKIDGNNRYYVLVVILAFVFMLDYFFLMNPQLSALGKINPEIKVLSDNIKKAKTDMKNLATYKEDLERLSSKFDQANLRVKSRNEVPVILEHVANIASETGVKIDQIMPDTLDQELITENNQRRYFDLPIYIEARSSYHNLGKFLSKVSKDGFSLNVGEFTIVSTNDMRFHLVKLTFRATVFEVVMP